MDVRRDHNALDTASAKPGDTTSANRGTLDVFETYTRDASGHAVSEHRYTVYLCTSELIRFFCIKYDNVSVYVLS